MTPIQKIYDIVEIKLENKIFPSSKLSIEALVTNEITGSHIPPTEVSELKKASILQKLTLTDHHSVRQDPVFLIIRAGYFYNIVTGCTKHVNKNLVFVETIFWLVSPGEKKRKPSFFNFKCNC